MNRFIFGCVGISMLLTPIVVAADVLLTDGEASINTEQAEVRADASASIIIPDDPSSQSVSTDPPRLERLPLL